MIDTPDLLHLRARLLAQLVHGRHLRVGQTELGAQAVADGVAHLVAPAVAAAVLVHVRFAVLEQELHQRGQLLVIQRRLDAREEQREENAEDREASEEDIETFIDEATEEGIIDKGEDELLRSVVEFGDTVVREVMTPRVNMVCLRRDATIDNLKDLIIREKYSRIPVYKDRLDNIEGIIHVKDLLAFSED